MPEQQALTLDLIFSSRAAPVWAGFPVWNESCVSPTCSSWCWGPAAVSDGAAAPSPSLGRGGYEASRQGSGPRRTLGEFALWVAGGYGPGQLPRAESQTGQQWSPPDLGITWGATPEWSWWSGRGSLLPVSPAARHNYREKEKSVREAQRTSRPGATVGAWRCAPLPPMCCTSPLVCGV